MRLRVERYCSTPRLLSPRGLGAWARHSGEPPRQKERAPRQRSSHLTFWGHLAAMRFSAERVAPPPALPGAHPETRIFTTKAQSSQSRNQQDQGLSFVSFVVVHDVSGRRLPKQPIRHCPTALADSARNVSTPGSAIPTASRGRPQTRDSRADLHRATAPGHRHSTSVGLSSSHALSSLSRRRAPPSDPAASAIARVA
jgi:hypothetical protein